MPSHAFVLSTLGESASALAIAAVVGVKTKTAVNPSAAAIFVMLFAFMPKPPFKTRETLILLGFSFLPPLLF
jgi:hypothetical protein